MCKISIIIPVYNVEQYIRICLESVLEQTFQDYEVLVINDGSKENEKEIILEFVDKDKRFKYIEKENGGQASARNLGIKNAKGEYIFFLDSDDYIRRDCLEILYQYSEGEVKDIVTSDIFCVEKESVTYFDTNIVYCDDKKKNYLLNASGPCAKLIRRDLIQSNNLYFPEGIIYEDVAIMGAYVLYTEKIVHVDEALYYYVWHEGSTMKQIAYHKKLEDIFRSLEILKSRFEENRKQDEYYSELEYIYISHMLHDASLRFFPFKEGQYALAKVVATMKDIYPHWTDNCYFKNQSWKYRIITKLFYSKKYRLLNLLLK